MLNLYLQYGKLPFVICILQGVFSGTVLTYISVNLTKIAVDSLLNDVPFKELIFMLLSLFLIQLFFSLWTQISKYFISEPFGIKFSAEIKRNVFTKVLETDFEKFDDPKFYDNYTWTSKRLATQSTQAASIVTNLLSQIIKVVTLLIMISIIDPVLIIFALLSVIITTILYRIVVKINYSHDTEYLSIEKRWNYLGRIFYLKEYFYELHTTDLSNLLFRRLNTNVEESVLLHKKYRSRLFGLDAMRLMTSTLFYIFAFLYLVYAATQKFISIGEFSSMLAAFGMLRSGIGNIVDEFIELQKMNLYTEKAKNFMEYKSRLETKEDKEQISSSPLHIEFKDVSFRYREGTPYVFQNLNLDVKPGKKIAIVGRNGVGKSTLVKLLLRLYDTSDGCIYINGMPISNIDIRELRKAIGVAFQQSHSYAESVRDNVVLYDTTSGISDDIIMESLNLFNLAHILSDNDVSLDTELSREFDKNGIELSGGQTQLLALSRLFIKKFGLVILDEPSSALDPLMEYNLNNTIMTKMNNVTVLIIAHRLSTIRDADYIYLLDNGKVIEEGDHIQLMKKCGKYYEMFTKQAEKYIE